MKQLKTILIMGFFATLFGCGQNKTDKSADELSDQNITKSVENINATNDQIERRGRSEEYCKSRDIHLF